MERLLVLQLNMDFFLLFRNYLLKIFPDVRKAMALDVAAEKGHYDVVREIAVTGFPVHLYLCSLSSALSDDQYDVVQILLESEIPREILESVLSNVTENGQTNNSIELFVEHLSNG